MASWNPLTGRPAASLVHARRLPSPTKPLTSPMDDQGWTLEFDLSREEAGTVGFWGLFRDIYGHQQLLQARGEPCQDARMPGVTTRVA